MIAAQRSSIFSILKIQFGWNGMVPDGCNVDEWERKIENLNDQSFGDIALYIADDINDHGGSFLERIDGHPNVRVPTRKINNFIKNDNSADRQEVKTETSTIDTIYKKVKQYLNNGIPDVHLSKGCIGELAVLAEYEHNPDALYAIIYIWQSEFNDFAKLREEFKRHGAEHVSISHTIDDEDNFVVDGVDESCARQILVDFRIK